MPPLGRPRRAGPALDRLRGGPPPVGPSEAEPTLQLAMGREGVGLELSAPLDLGVAKLMAARARMVGVGFPLDVSGGVDRFRHRRTALDLATLSIDHAKAERWIAHLADDLLRPGATEVRVRWSAAPRPDDGAAAIPPLPGMDPPRGARGPLRVELSAGDAIVAFDAVLAADGSGLSLIAHRPRSVATELPATALVGRLLQRVATAAGGEAHGLRWRVSDPLRLAVVGAFVTRGARVPTRTGLVATALVLDETRWSFTLERDAVRAAPSRLFVALDELDRLIGDADEAFVEGQLDRAREEYLRALEQAPRHRTILTRLAEVDAALDRAEAALVWLREAQKVRSRRSVEVDDNELGRLLLAGRMHQRLRTAARARAAFERAGVRAFDDDEVRLAAKAFARASTFVRDDDPELLPLLDRALGADPTEADARWRRVRVRVVSGEDTRALEDVQHLEAQARGRDARRAMLLRAASVWREAGRLDRAVAAYERALRYAPDDAGAVCGLGLSLLAAGEVGRGISLLSQSLELADLTDTRLHLARALGERIADLPTAIARLREVGDDDARAACARALEASYRARLGDVVGAERAWSRAADLLERRGASPEDAALLSPLFLEAAYGYEASDPSTAHRLALAAVATSPEDERSRALARRLGEQQLLSRDAQEEPEEAASRGAPLPVALGDPTTFEGEDARAEVLLARVKANPDDHAAIDELIELLASLGRDLELFALLQARYDEADDALRAELAPRQREVLERLASAALGKGRAAEAAIYAEAARRL